RRQAEGIEPQSFDSIEARVLMLHGDEDPHPGAMIRDSLRPCIPQIEYVEIARCGHEPWRERHGREPFFAALRAWLRDAMTLPALGRALEDLDELRALLRDAFEEPIGGAHGLPPVDQVRVDWADALVRAEVAPVEGPAPERLQAPYEHRHVLGHR